jgi:hypothetical protein
MMNVADTHKGRIVVQGLVFDWNCEDGKVLQVYNLQYGLRLTPLEFRSPETLAKVIAIDMIGAGPRAAASSVAARQ